MKQAQSDQATHTQKATAMRCRRNVSTSIHARDVLRFLSLFSVLVAALLNLGCTSKTKSLTIYVAGDTQGWITPCGCTSNQSGGLARRAELIDFDKQKGDVLLLDVGGSAIGTTAYQRLKFEALLDGLKLMGLAAMNVGAAETKFTPQELNEIGLKTGTRWLASNLQDSSGAAFGSNKLEFELAKMKVAVVGVIDPNLVSSNAWQATDAVPAILKSFGPSSADVKIVLAYFDEPGLRALAQALPEVDYVIGGPTGQAVMPSRVGSTTIMSTTNKGKFLARIELQKSGDLKQETDARITEVSSTLSESDVQLKNLAAYYEALSKKDFRSDEAGLLTSLAVNQPDYAIAGSASCVSCHQVDDNIWHQSKHSHAWNVLEMKNAHFDPHCQQCHTTGYGLPGGFVNVAVSRNLVHVGCENCHGPSQAHVINPKKKTPFKAMEQCIRCHDHENSPSFSLDAYWPKIAHGKTSIGNQDAK